jgi:hypothetical protein
LKPKRKDCGFARIAVTAKAFWNSRHSEFSNYKKGSQRLSRLPFLFKKHGRGLAACSSQAASPLGFSF